MIGMRSIEDIEKREAEADPEEMPGKLADVNEKNERH